MSDDVESRLLDLELRFGNFLAATAEKYGKLGAQTAKSAEQTAAVITVVLEELITDGLLDRSRLVRAMETHAAGIHDDNSGTGRIAVDTLLSSLRGSQSGGGTRSKQ